MNGHAEEVNRMRPGRPEVSFDVVVPTVGRQSLGRLVERLAEAGGSATILPGRVFLVFDRFGDGADIPLSAGTWLDGRLEVLPGPGRGPAAARNVGWREGRGKWIAFLDDDVVPAVDWLYRLVRDLEALEPDVAGTQGRLRVPLPAGRRPTGSGTYPAWSAPGGPRPTWPTGGRYWRRSEGSMNGFHGPTGKTQTWQCG
jgi:Glycosyl transferase family 2